MTDQMTEQESRGADRAHVRGDSDASSSVLSNTPGQPRISRRTTSGHWVRAAFYGRTNASGVNGTHILARQYEACVQIADGRAESVGFYYDFLEASNEITILAVRGAGGPSRRDGSWDDLLAAARRDGRDFDLVLISSLDRLAPAIGHSIAFRDLLAAHNLSVVTADEMADAFPRTDGGSDGRLLATVAVAIYE